MKHGKSSLYGYAIDKPAAISFIALFAVTGVLHIGQSLYYKVWWLIPTFALCALGEVLGWTGRYWSTYDDRALNPYLMQICCTIMAPSFLSAGLFFILGAIINRLGPQYATLSPKAFSYTFIGCDIAALCIQSIGGAIASIQFEKGNDPDGGSKIMVGGIIFQIVAVTMYAVAAAEFALRYTYDRPVRRKATWGLQRDVITLKILLQAVGMVVATILLYIRSVYRTIELLDGWTGPIIHSQALFNYMDALPITLALFSLNALNPGFLLFSNGEHTGRQLTRTDTRVALEAIPQKVSGSEDEDGQSTAV